MKAVPSAFFLFYVILTISYLRAQTGRNPCGGNYLVLTCLKCIVLLICDKCPLFRIYENKNKEKTRNLVRFFSKFWPQSRKLVLAKSGSRMFAKLSTCENYHCNDHIFIWICISAVHIISIPFRYTDYCSNNGNVTELEWQNSRKDSQ